MCLAEKLVYFADAFPGKAYFFYRHSNCLIKYGIRVVSDEMMLSARHEMLHVVAMNLRGLPARWINEGLAWARQKNGYSD